MLTMSFHSGASNTSDIVNSENLTFSLLIFSSTNLTVIIFFWTYLVYSFTLSTTCPPLFPHILLLGQFIGSSSSLASVTLDPTSKFYFLPTVLVPISYTMIYSTLLVRLVYLHSLHKAMLPTLYQTLLLLFCILVQISASTQSLLCTQLTACPSPVSIYSTSFTDLHCLSYSCFLLLSITCFSTGMRRRREYRGEARSIWIFCILSMSVWIAWVALALVFQEHYTVVKSRL